jgi:energy-coupling factor transporter ATP-binding protein EcfA2
MGKMVPLQDPENYRRALQRIKRLWEEGKVLILSHAKGRMRKRGIDILDIQHVIRYGSVIEHSKPRNLWRYTLKGTSVDGDSIGCVVEIDGRLIIVTVIDDTRRRRPSVGR